MFGYAALARAGSKYAVGIRRTVVVALLSAALVLGVWQRIGAKAQRPGITGDEGISLLAATCHEGAFMRALHGGPPYGRWTPAREWQRFVAPERLGCFATISRDLALVDLHPPLYFWILHLWFSATGPRAWSLVLLNVAFALGTIAALYVLGERLFASPLAGATVALTWAANPLAAAGGFEGRPYDLLALVVAGFFVQLVTACRPHRISARAVFLWLFLWTTLGTLTHYSFLLVLLGGAVFATLHVARMGAQRSLWVLGSVVAGLCLASLLHPILGHIARKRHGALWVLPSQFAPFAKLKAKALAQQLGFFGAMTQGAAKGGTVVAMALAGLGVAAIVLAVMRHRALTAWRPRFTGFEIAVAATSVVAATTYFYATGKLPRHAMNAKYVSFVWPLLSVLPLLVTRVLVPLERASQFALVGLLVLAGVRGLDRHPDLASLRGPIAATAPQPPFALLTESWHPTAAWIARHNPDSQLFIASPVDGGGALYATWLHGIGRGVEAELVIPEVDAKLLLQRLRGEHHHVSRVGRYVKNDYGHFLVRLH